MAVQLAQHYRFTVDQYQRLAREGYIDPHARVELIDGEIIEMSPVGSHHNAVVDAVAQSLIRQLAGSYIVRTQGSIQLNELRAPQPDIAVLEHRADFYKHALPGSGDVLLVVEVADTSLTYDREAKAALYAQVQIPEYWLVDLIHNAVRLHTLPAPLGYQQVETKHRGDSWASHSLPQLAMSGTDIFI